MCVSPFLAGEYKSSASSGRIMLGLEVASHRTPKGRLSSERRLAIQGVRLSLSLQSISALEVSRSVTSRSLLRRAAQSRDDCLALSRTVKSTMSFGEAVPCLCSVPRPQEKCDFSQLAIFRHHVNVLNPYSRYSSSIWLSSAARRSTTCFLRVSGGCWAAVLRAFATMLSALGRKYLWSVKMVQVLSLLSPGRCWRRWMIKMQMGSCWKTAFSSGDPRA